MSLLKTPEASPSRIYAILALATKMPGSRVEVEKLKQMISPHAFQTPDKKETDFIGESLPEMLTLGLIELKDGVIHIPESLISEKDQLATALSRIVRERLSQGNAGNKDMIETIAWYMMQNSYHAPGNWRSVEEALLRQLKTKMDCTSDARYGQFEDWATYMGFTTKVQKQLIPNPTRVIRQFLPQIFESKQTMNVADIVKKLAQLSAVFEGGQVREALNLTYGIEKLQEGQLSQSTSLAWLRLHDEQIITLVKKSDADIYLFSEMNDQHRYSEITWNGQGVV